MNKLLVLSIAICAFIFTGCSQRMASFSVASTANMTIPNAKKGAYVEGKDCVVIILGIPIGNLQDRISNAISLALEDAHEKGEPDEGLMNVSIHVQNHGIGLFGKNCVVAKGQAFSVKNK